MHLLELAAKKSCVSVAVVFKNLTCASRKQTFQLSCTSARCSDTENSNSWTPVTVFTSIFFTKLFNQQQKLGLRLENTGEKSVHHLSDTSKLPHFFARTRTSLSFFDYAQQFTRWSIPWKRDFFQSKVLGNNLDLAFLLPELNSFFVSWDNKRGFTVVDCPVCQAKLCKNPEFLLRKSHVQFGSVKNSKK